MKVVICAGGKGSRISSLFNDIPKPMIKFGDKPILEHEIICLRDQGFKDIVLTISHMGDIIKDYFKDGKWLGVNIDYYFEETPLGNAGALFKIKDKLTEDFLLLNADSMFDIDFNRFVKFHKSKGGLASIFVHPNYHPYDSGIVFIDENDSVTKWLAKEDDKPKWYRNLVNAGIHILSPKLLEQSFEQEKIDLDRMILKPLCGTNKLFAYQSSEYVRDMGTPDRFYSVSKDFQSGLVHKRNLVNKQKAIFLDRDGTINKYVGFLRDIDDFELLPNVAKAIRMINDSEYLAIVVSNQPVIARGEVSYEELDEIHNKMETLLGNEGAYLDAIYYCPHHPDKGFKGERKELKIDCDCRKPKIGLLLKAKERFNIDLESSYFVGDTSLDIQTGKNAKMKTILIKTGSTDDRYDAEPDYVINDLTEIKDII